MQLHTLCFGNVSICRTFTSRLTWTMVKEVQRLLKQQLDFEVILLDANTSSTDEVSSVSDMVHLERFSDFARRRHVHHTSDFFHAIRFFLVVVIKAFDVSDLVSNHKFDRD